MFKLDISYLIFYLKKDMLLEMTNKGISEHFQFQIGGPFRLLAILNYRFFLTLVLRVEKSK